MKTMFYRPCFNQFSKASVSSDIAFPPRIKNIKTAISMLKDDLKGADQWDLHKSYADKCQKYKRDILTHKN